MTDKDISNMLGFSGSVTASVSHEIKNHMAIINEYAGLLEDLVYMYNQGKAPETERFSDIAGKIKKQIKEADAVIGNLNRFAHTSDNFYSLIDINEVLVLSGNLFKRIFKIKEVELETLPYNAPIKAHTSFFLLMNLILSVLENFTIITGEGKIVKLCSEIRDKKAAVFINCEDAIRNDIDKSVFLKDYDKMILSELKAEFFFDRDRKEAAIMLPADIT